MVGVGISLSFLPNEVALMRKLALLFLLFFMLTLSPLSHYQEGGTSEPPSILPIPVVASEEENIDSFSVHPAQRWPYYATSGITDVIDKGILVVTDVGDGTSDGCYMIRYLQKTDDKIEMRFKIDTNGYADTWDYYKFIIAGEDANNYFMLHLTDFNDSNYYDTEIEYTSLTGGGARSTDLNGSERFFDNEWYIFKVTFNILESKMRFRLSFDNGTSVFNYIWQELKPGQGHTPSLFGQQNLEIRVSMAGATNGVTNIFYTDYIKAPFVEAYWEQTTDGADADWLQEQPLGVVVQDDILGEWSVWEVTVPDLDVVSGIMFNGGAIFASSADKEASIAVAIFGVDADDGDLHEVGRIKLQKNYGSYSTNYSIIEGGTTLGDSYIHATIAYTPRAEFSMALVDDRELLEIKGRCYHDHSDEDSFGDIYGLIEVGDYVDDPSNEFVIRVAYYCDFTADLEFSMNFEEFAFVHKDIFADIGRAIGNLISSFFEFIFIGLFKFLATIFKVVGELIIAAVDALAPLLTGLATWLNDIWTVIEEITGWATGILNDILSAFADIGQIIWIYFENLVSDLAIWLQDILDLVIPTLLSFLGTIITSILEFGWAFWYGLWAAVGLEGVFEIGDLLFTGFLQFITGLPQFINDWVAFLVGISSLFAVLGFIWIFIFPIALGNDVSGYFDGLIFTASFDITLGISALGFKVPIPIFIPWSLIVIYTFLTGTFFYGFF